MSMEYQRMQAALDKLKKAVEEKNKRDNWKRKLTKGKLTELEWSNDKDGPEDRRVG